MTVRSVFSLCVLCTSVVAVADGGAEYVVSESCDAYTFATDIAPAPRRSDRKRTDEGSKVKRMRSRTKSSDSRAVGDSIFSLKSTDSFAVDSVACRSRSKEEK